MVNDEVARVKGRVPDANWLDRKAERIDCVDGIRLVYSMKLNGGEALLCAWLGCQGGHRYKLLVVGPIGEKAVILEQADLLFSQFKILDPKQVLSRADLPAPPAFTSPVFGYRVQLPASAGWIASAKPGSLFGGSEYAAVIAPRTGLAVTPMFIGFDLPAEQVACACCRMLRVDWDHATRDKLPARARFTGYRLNFTNPARQPATSYRCDVWVGDGFGFVVLGWTTDPKDLLTIDAALASVNLDSVPPLNAAVDAFSLEVRRVAPFNRERLTAPQHDLSALVLNHLGLDQYASRDYDAAAKLFDASLNHRVDPVVCENLLKALFGAGKLQQGAEVAKAAVKKFPEHLGIASAAAEIMAEAGQKDAAIVVLSKLFSFRVVDDERFYRFVQLLLDAGKASDALTEVRQYRQRSDTAIVALAESETLSELKRPDEALAVLQSWFDKKAYDETIAVALAYSQLRENRPQEAIKVADRMLSERAESSQAQVIKGHALMALKRFADAKTAYESAKQVAPGDSRIEGYLRAASSAAGQGTNSAIKTPLEPVPLPADLGTTPTASTDKSAGAAYRLYATAIEFLPGNRQRSTEYMVVDIFDQRGIEMFTTLTYRINPLDEKIYVNQLEVRDESGQVIGKGKPEDFYALDVNGDVSATQDQAINLPVPGIRPGCTLYAIITREYQTPPDRFRFTEQLLAHCAADSALHALANREPRSSQIH